MRMRTARTEMAKDGHSAHEELGGEGHGRDCFWGEEEKPGVMK